MKGSTYKRCGCKDPVTGRPMNSRCPDLAKRRHGTWTFDTHIDTTVRAGRRLKRAGYTSSTKAEAALDHVRDLVKLAGDDAAMRARIGDLIVDRSRHGGELPAVDEVKRRLGAGSDLAAPNTTVTEWLEEWLAGKRRLKDSTRVSYRHHLDHFFIPILGDIPRDKLRVEHIAGLFDRIEEWNAEIIESREEGRKPHLPDDCRKIKKLISVSTQHRILSTLRNAYNVAVKRPGMIDWNPCLAVELPPVRRDPARVWSPEQVVVFLNATGDHRLGLLYRIILLRGLRRGEGCGLRWVDLDEEARRTKVVQAVLRIGGRIVIDTPKTAAGEREVSLDSGTVALVPELRRRQHRERFAAGEAYQDHGLMFCQEDGRPLSPDRVTKEFRRLAGDAGLPVIKLHEARHTAATLGLEAGLDIKIVSDQLGHSSTRITQDLYTHVRQALHDDAAEKVLSLLPKQERETGS